MAQQDAPTDYQKYYVPDQSPWPIVGAVALFLIAVGAGNFVVEQTRDKEGFGHYILIAGFITLLVMLVGWFKNQIDESMSGLYSAQLGRSYRQGMLWFIFSEVMFFAAFFGALFYARTISVPWLGGSSNNAMTNEVLWPAFEAVWPLLSTPGGTTTEAMPWTGLPLYNTAILLISSVTLHYAHVGLEQNKRKQLLTLLGVNHFTRCIIHEFTGLRIHSRVSRPWPHLSKRCIRQYIFLVNRISRYACHPWGNHFKR